MIVKRVKKMLADEGAVSPVIGIILMVAVTVVLAAVIAGFVFGIGDDTADPAPNAQLDFDYDTGDDILVVSHDGGEAITGEDTSELSISGDYELGENPFTGEDFIQWEVGDAEEGETSTSLDDVSITAGDEIVQMQFEDSEGNSVELHWVASGGESSATLGTFDQP